MYTARFSQTEKETQIVKARLFLWFAQDKKEEICAGDPDDIASLSQTAKETQTGTAVLFLRNAQGNKKEVAPFITGFFPPNPLIFPILVA